MTSTAAGALEVAGGDAGGARPDIFANYTLLNIKYSHNAPETASLWPLLMGHAGVSPGNLFATTECELGGAV